MKLKERRDQIHTMTDEQLQEELRNLREELFRLRFQYANRQQKNVQLYTARKKDVARVLTEIRARELEALAGIEQ